jgi:ferredoxin
VHRIVTEHEAEIEARFPKVMRRVGGYNLDELIRDKPFNLAKLVCGSEGTLAFVLDVTLRVHPVPARRCLVMLHFDSLVGALETVPFINRHGPSAVEIMDRDLFKLARENPTMLQLLGWLRGDPAAVLAVEFEGDDDDDLRRQLASLEADGEVGRRIYASHVALADGEQSDILEFRRMGLGIYATMRGRSKPTPFVEDAAIPVEHLARYIPEVLEVCKRHGTTAVFYAHASVGVIHVRPLIDLKTVKGVATYRAISNDVFELVKRYGGSWSGEHGDGLIRSDKNRALFGEVVYEDFRAIKRAFDPNGRFNPGKIVDALPMTQNLRYGPDYREPSVQTVLDFSAQEGFQGAIEACTGVGACRKQGVGTMCPSYMATRDEDHSTRGRANVLREALVGRLPGGLTSKGVYDVLDLCLECKACKAECPSQVDMAKLKYEFPAALPRRARHAAVGTRVIGGIARARAARAGGGAARERRARGAPGALAERAAARGRSPRPAPPTLRLVAAFRPRPSRVAGRERTRRGTGAAAQSRRTVALYADTWTMFNEPGARRTPRCGSWRRWGTASSWCRTAAAAGRSISKGLLRQAKRQAQGVVDGAAAVRRARRADRGPGAVVRHGAQGRLPRPGPGPKADAVAAGVWMLDAFLAKAWTRGEIDLGDRVLEERIAALLHHGHCQQKAVLGTASTRAVLEWTSRDVKRPRRRLLRDGRLVRVRPPRRLHDDRRGPPLPRRPGARGRHRRLRLQLPPPDRRRHREARGARERGAGGRAARAGRCLRTPRLRRQWAERRLGAARLHLLGSGDAERAERERQASRAPWRRALGAPRGGRPRPGRRRCPAARPDRGDCSRRSRRWRGRACTARRRATRRPRRRPRRRPASARSRVRAAPPAVRGGTSPRPASPTPRPTGRRRTQDARRACVGVLHVGGRVAGEAQRLLPAEVDHAPRLALQHGEAERAQADRARDVVDRVVDAGEARDSSPPPRRRARRTASSITVSIGERDRPCARSSPAPRA